MLANKTNFVIEQSHIDGFEAVTFGNDRVTGKLEDEFSRFVELDGDKIGVGERPAVACFKDDIQSDGSLDIGRSFRSRAECREIGLGGSRVG